MYTLISTFPNITNSYVFIFAAASLLLLLPHLKDVLNITDHQFKDLDGKQHLAGFTVT